MELPETILRADLIDKENHGNEKKDGKVTELGGFCRVLMTFPSIFVKIIASASVHMRLEKLSVAMLWACLPRVRAGCGC